MKSKKVIEDFVEGLLKYASDLSAFQIAALLLGVEHSLVKTLDNRYQLAAVISGADRMEPSFCVDEVVDEGIELAHEEPYIDVETEVNLEGLLEEAKALTDFQIAAFLVGLEPTLIEKCCNKYQLAAIWLNVEHQEALRFENWNQVIELINDTPIEEILESNIQVDSESQAGPALYEEAQAGPALYIDLWHE